MWIICLAATSWPAGTAILSMQERRQVVSISKLASLQTAAT